MPQNLKRPIDWSEMSIAAKNTLHGDDLDNTKMDMLLDGFDMDCNTLVVIHQCI